MDTVRREVFTVREVSAIFGVSPNTIYRWTHSDSVRVIRFGDRILIPRMEVERLLQGDDEDAVHDPPHLTAA